MNSLPNELFREICTMLDRDSLNQLSRTCYKFSTLINSYFPINPKYRYRALTILSLSNNTVIIKIERSSSLILDDKVVERGSYSFTDNMSLTKLKNLLAPKYAQFDGMFFGVSINIKMNYI